MLKAQAEYRRLLDSLEKGEPRSLYVLAGEEAFHLRLAARKLEELLTTGGDRRMNVDRVDGEGSNPHAWIAAASTATLLGGRRLVIVSNADRWLSAAEAKNDATEALMAYAGRRNGRGAVMMLAKGLDRRLKVVKALEETGSLFFFEGLKGDAEVLEWMRAALAHRGLRVDDGVADYLASCFGGDLESAAEEIKRLRAYLGDEVRVLELSEVQGIVVPTRQYTVFEFVDALGEGNATRALKILDRLFEGGIKQGDRKVDSSALPLNLMALIHRQLKQFARARKLGGQDPDKLAFELGVPAFVARKIHGKASRLSEAHLEALLDLCVSTDVALKSSSLPGQVLLERLVFDACIRP
jgi:DNA polymerase-3 subunit delta